jgi:hypothetical protein
LHCDTLHTYNTNNQIISIIPTCNGSIEGEAIWYYSNGSIKAKEHFEKGVRFGPAFYYDSSNIIKSHKYFDHLGGLSFYAKYDSIGDIYEYDGCLMLIHPNINIDSVRITDTLKVELLTVEPINYSVVFDIIMIFERDTNTIVEDYVVKEKIPLLELTFDSIGSRNLFVTMGLKSDLRNEIIFADTFKFDFNVME